jgi:putative ABC transport system permease protein
MTRDVRLALRRLRMAPGFTVFAVVSLALGIGVSTAIYSAVRTLFWMPLGIAEPESLVSFAQPGRATGSISWPDFLDIRAQQSTFSSLAATERLQISAAIDDTAEAALGEAVSGDYFTTLGVSALHGRLLQPLDETLAARVVVLSEVFWRTRLHADPHVVGRTMKLGGEPFEIVGVTKGPFHGMQALLPGSLWILHVSVPDRAGTGRLARVRTDRTIRPFNLWGRLKPGILLSTAAAEAAVIGQRLDAAYPPPSAAPADRRRTWTVRDQSAGAEIDREDVLASMILAAVAMVLLIACTNLANLSLAKGTSRAQETAVRTALGASRWRLVREQLIESAIVAVAGGILGLGVLVGLRDFFTTDLPISESLTIRFAPVIGMAVLGAAAGATMLALIVFGLWPALQSTRQDVRSGLGAGAVATPPKWRLHRNLVAWQVFGSVALLMVAAMTVQAIAAFGAHDPGVDYERLAIAQLDFSLNGKDEARSRVLVDAILSAARAQPGIGSVSASTGLPFGIMPPSAVVTRPQQPFVESRDVGEYTHVIAATPEILATLGMRIVRGRAFSDRDDAAAPRVAILSESIAREVFHTTDVVGNDLLVGRTYRLSTRYPPESFRVIGVTADTDTFMLGRRGNPGIFVPFAQRYSPSVTITARAADPRAAAGVLRTVIRTVDPELAVTSNGQGAVVLAGPYVLMRIVAGLASALGALALVLAMAGLYGVLSHVVARRTREIGIRIAIGAHRSRIFELILRDGLRPVVKGLVLGLGAGVLFRIALRATVATGISPIDPLVFALVPIPFLIAALIACYLPAARASRVDPNVALRDL